MMTSSRYHSTDTKPKTQVLNAGVRCLASTSASLSGTALWTPIDSIVRVAGRIVVWHEAEADVSTAMISSL